MTCQRCGGRMLQDGEDVSCVLCGAVVYARPVMEPEAARQEAERQRRTPAHMHRGMKLV